MSLRHRLADLLIQAAARRTRRRHPEWADAMLSEHASLSDNADQLDWAVGSLRASLGVENASHSLFLTLAVGAMVAYQWSADESLVTLTVMIALAMLLGGLRPTRFVVSGLALGVVVASVNAFETFSGVRPAYETYPHTWLHDLRWLWLVLPALAGSAVGGRIGSHALDRI